MFVVDQDCKKLNPRRAKEFHYIVAKTLHATKLVRSNTCIAVAILTIRVREPDKDYWAKLTHLMMYFKGTKDLPLILNTDGTGILKW